jgi:hypothetical protein
MGKSEKVEEKESDSHSGWFSRHLFGYILAYLILRV